LFKEKLRKYSELAKKDSVVGKIASFYTQKWNDVLTHKHETTATCQYCREDWSEMFVMGGAIADCVDVIDKYLATQSLPTEIEDWQPGQQILK